MALSALQARIAWLALHLPEAEGFVLAGGGAMLAHGLVDRPTQDLDQFAREPARLGPFAAAITRALQAAGLDAQDGRVAPTFRQVIVTDEQETVLVEIAHDARLWPASVLSLGAVLSIQELAADKTLALVHQLVAETPHRVARPSPVESSSRSRRKRLTWATGTATRNERSPPPSRRWGRLAAIDYGSETVVTAQPEHPHAPETEPRGPRTINGIADALTGARRMEFYRAVGQAEAGPELQHVIATWWGEAMLDTDPERDRIIEAVHAGTLPTVTMAEVLQRRRANGGAMTGE